MKNSITLKKLQSLVSESTKEEKTLSLLKEEVSKNLGASISVNDSLIRIVESLNSTLDVYERTGRERKINLKSSVLLRLKEHKNPEVRKLLARLLPIHLAENFKFDRSDIVRHAIAKRLSLAEVRKMCKLYKDDDQLHEIYKAKNKEEKDFSCTKTLIDTTSKNILDAELSEEWYKKVAYKAILDYAWQFDYEDLWIGPWVQTYCKSLSATSGVHIDAKKLSNEIKKQLETKDER